VKATLRNPFSTKEEGTGPLDGTCELQQNKEILWTVKKRSMIITRHGSKRIRYLRLMRAAGTYVIACFFLTSVYYDSIPQLPFASLTECDELVGTTYQFFYGFHNHFAEAYCSLCTAYNDHTACVYSIIGHDSRVSLRALIRH
jgi:hypothetical protein